MIKFSVLSGLFGLGFFLVASIHSFAPSGPDQKPLPVPRALGKIYIDGNLDESVWAKVPPVGPFLVYPTRDPEQGEVTEAKMLWDDDNLYIVFKTFDKNILATRTQRHSDVFNDDCVEAFISPFPDSPHVYTNIEINALGTFLSEIHLAKPNPELSKLAGVIQSRYSQKPETYLWSPPGLQIGRQHKGTINDESDEDSWWIIEMSIPLKTFFYLGIERKPKEGDIWRFNLYRLGGKTRPPRRNLFFIPEPLSNHSPEYFGRLLFSK